MGWEVMFAPGLSECNLPSARDRWVLKKTSALGLSCEVRASGSTSPVLSPFRFCFGPQRLENRRGCGRTVRRTESQANLVGLDELLVQVRDPQDILGGDVSPLWLRPSYHGAYVPLISPFEDTASNSRWKALVWGERLGSCTP